MRSTGTNYATVQETLVALVQDEDQYNNYLTSLPASDVSDLDEGWRAQSIDPTSFDTLTAQIEQDQEQDEAVAVDITPEASTAPDISRVNLE